MVCRAAWLLLVGCSSAASRPVEPPVSAPGTKAAAGGPTADTYARIEIDSESGLGSWVDVSVVGNTALERTRCELLVDRARAGRERTRVRLVRPCEARSLPELPNAGPTLVSTEAVDRNTITIEEIANGTQDRDPAPMRGEVITYERFADAEACTSARRELEAADQRPRLVKQREIIVEIDHRLVQAMEQLPRACASPGSADCKELERRRQLIQLDRDFVPTPTTVTRMCR